MAASSPNAQEPGGNFVRGFVTPSVVGPRHDVLEIVWLCTQGPGSTRECGAKVDGNDKFVGFGVSHSEDDVAGTLVVVFKLSRQQ